MKKIKVIVGLILGIIFVASIVANVFFLMGKGIHVHNDYDHRVFNDLRQFQTQGMLSVSMWALKGHFAWDKKEFNSKGNFKQDYDDAYEYLKQLPIEVSFFAELNFYYVNENEYFISMVFPVVDEEYQKAIETRAEYNKK